MASNRPNQQNDRARHDHERNDYSRDAGSRDAGSRSSGRDRDDDESRSNNPDRYRGREGGSNQFSSWRNDPADVRSGSQAEPSRGQHAGRGPKGYRRDDARITEDVNEILTHDSHIDASEIEVSVSDGEVTLSGTVDSRDAKRHAEDLAERVSGVNDVDNRIRVVKAERHASAKADAAMSHAAGSGPSGAANTTVTSNNPSGKPSPNTSGASTQRTGDRGSHG